MQSTPLSPTPSVRLRINKCFDRRLKRIQSVWAPAVPSCSFLLLSDGCFTEIKQTCGNLETLRLRLFQQNDHKLNLKHQNSHKRAENPTCSHPGVHKTSWEQNSCSPAQSAVVLDSYSVLVQTFYHSSSEHAVLFAQKTCNLITWLFFFFRQSKREWLPLFSHTQTHQYHPHLYSYITTGNCSSANTSSIYWRN